MMLIGLCHRIEVALAVPPIGMPEGNIVGSRDLIGFFGKIPNEDLESRAG